MQSHTDNKFYSEQDWVTSEPLTSRRDFLLLLTGLPALGMLGLPEMEAEAALRKTQRSVPLQHAVNQYIQQQRRRGRIPRNERTAWSVYDFTTGKKLVAINEDVPLQSASMVKPFIALAYFYRHQENPRRYPYDARIRYLMEVMIRKSDNKATNELIRRIGGKAANKPKAVEYLLKRYGGGIFQHTSIVEYIPRNGRAYRNKSSAHDYSRFLYALWHNRLPYARELKHYMGLSNEDRIRSGAKAVPANTTQIYDKTGSTARLCGDMGILIALGKNNKIYPYTFIGIIEKSRRTNNYGHWIRDRGNVLREVSSLVYRDMKKRHRLL